jgi:hypothetical protein
MARAPSVLPGSVEIRGELVAAGITAATRSPLWERPTGLPDGGIMERPCPRAFGTLAHCLEMLFVQV